MNLELKLNSVRARKARFSVRFNRNYYKFLYALTIILLIICIFSFTFNYLTRFGYLILSIALFFGMILVWYYQDLKNLAINLPPKRIDDILSPDVLARLRRPITPKTAWSAALSEWSGHFICGHLQIDPNIVASGLTNNEADMDIVWQQATVIMQHHKLEVLDGGILVTALIVASAPAQKYITELNLKLEDVLEVHAWVARLQRYINQPRPNFGGIARDWASGYIPTLERFSQNISNAVEVSGSYAHFLSNADVLTHVINNLNQGSAVALVGPPGTGKTSLIFGLAERLLEGKDNKLKHYQIVSLNASSILSENSLQIERTMLMLFGEAMHAGNIILFLDEAQLFFSSGVGAFNMSQLLLPVLQNHRIKIIAAFSPSSWQKLRVTNESLAANFASVIIPEPPMGDTLKVMEDRALQLEARDHVTITYEAIREAYRLSGQFMQELAYPGKAISLLDQSMPYVEDGLLKATSIQTAIEKMKGVKVSAASAPEADVLLHLEDKIHQRMVNQVRAVNVVSSALRRGRAGVANPKRPVGSFLFLGPTGVGKTELARSLAATYFHDEKQMIRLDMSEYQRPEDVVRLLSTGEITDHSLIMSIREQPFSVVLLDEIEKSHAQILNLLLQILDEGQLTDSSGRPASFRNSIIIATSNAGSIEIADRVNSGGGLEDFERPLIDKLIREEIFRAELINRFDEIVLFRPLNEPELGQVAGFMLEEVNKTLSSQNISVELSEQAMNLIVHAGYDPQFGARPMRRVMQKTVEDAVAMKILRGEAKAGSVIKLDLPDIQPLLQR
jgi:ATP-dependent Clp protease ATP-binding subunit ClpC